MAWKPMTVWHSDISSWWLGAFGRQTQNHVHGVFLVRCDLLVLLFGYRALKWYRLSGVGPTFKCDCCKDKLRKHWETLLSYSCSFLDCYLLHPQYTMLSTRCSKSGSYWGCRCRLTPPLAQLHEESGRETVPWLFSKNIAGGARGGWGGLFSGCASYLLPLPSSFQINWKSI